MMEAAEMVMHFGGDKEAQDTETPDLIQNQMIAAEIVAMVKDEAHTVVIEGIKVDQDLAQPTGIKAEMLIARETISPTQKFYNKIEERSMRQEP